MENGVCGSAQVAEQTNTHEKHLETVVRHAKGLLGDSIRVVVELGARACNESRAFAELLPGADIYAFECNPDTLNVCRQSIRNYPNVHLMEYAVTDKCGSISFFKTDPTRTKTTWADGNPGASSLFHASGKYPVEQYAQIEVTVPAVTLHRFMSDHSLETIDLLWMDIQGAELLALQGLGELISKVKIIQTEVEFLEIYQGQPLYRDLRRFLEDHGFRLLTFTTFGRYSADAIFVNNRYFKNHRMPDSLIYGYHWTKAAFRGAAGRVRRLVTSGGS